MRIRGEARGVPRTVACQAGSLWVRSVELDFARRCAHRSACCCGATANQRTSGSAVRLSPRPITRYGRIGRPPIGRCSGPQHLLHRQPDGSRNQRAPGSLTVACGGGNQALHSATMSGPSSGLPNFVDRPRRVRSGLVRQWLHLTGSSRTPSLLGSTMGVARTATTNWGPLRQNFHCLGQRGALDVAVEVRGCTNRRCCGALDGAPRTTLMCPVDPLAWR